MMHIAVLRSPACSRAGKRAVRGGREATTGLRQDKSARCVARQAIDMACLLPGLSVGSRAACLDFATHFKGVSGTARGTGRKTWRQ